MSFQSRFSLSNVLMTRQPGSRRDRTRRRGLSVETLEGRQLLSTILTRGPETRMIANVMEVLSARDDSGDDPPITHPELPPSGPVGPGSSS